MGFPRKAYQVSKQLFSVKLCFALITGNKLPQVILLDTRYHRDPLRSDGTILGRSQWEWLEKELNDSPTAITIIGSSIQVCCQFMPTLY